MKTSPKLRRKEEKVHQKDRRPMRNRRKEAKQKREQEGMKGSPAREVANSETVWTANARRRPTTSWRKEGNPPRR